MGQLEDMQLFIRVVDAGGIGRAAEQLGIAKSAVSRRLSELEARLGCRLIQRTTRTSSLTDIGQRYYAQAQKLIDQVDEVHLDMVNESKALSGSIRLAVPLSFGLLHLSSAIDLFIKQHPGISVQLDFSDRQVDLVEEGFDLALRIADLQDSSIQARKICASHHVLVASPDYLAQKGEPKKPADLRYFDYLKYGSGNQSHFSLFDQKGLAHKVNLNAKMTANNGDFLLQMVKAGHGVTFLPSFLAWQALATGDLVQILKPYTLPSLNIYFVYPQNRFLPQRVRALMDFVIARFGDNPYWDQALN
ncbi:MAG: LysR family transcriptional regulator [Marinomonas sp.]